MAGGRRTRLPGATAGFPGTAAAFPKTTAAIAYARQEHAGQQRAADGAPFIEHPLEVAMLLYSAGATDVVVAAGVLHDTLEKTQATEPELRARFGARVAALVSAVSEDGAILGYSRRKAALREQVATAGRDALTVFAADKLSKVRELHLAGASPPRPGRLEHYRQSLQLLEARLPDSPLVSELRAKLDSLPPAPKRAPTRAR
jgi:(p)ppGpp synthase/HD superfamily hydrolase